MYITSESVSALQIFYPFGYRFVCMYETRPLSEVRQHRLYDVDGSFVLSDFNILPEHMFVNTKSEHIFDFIFILYHFVPFYRTIFHSSC